MAIKRKKVTHYYDVKSPEIEIHLDYLRMSTTESKAEGVALVELVHEVVEGKEWICIVSHHPQFIEEGVVIIPQQLVEVILGLFSQHYTPCFCVRE